MNQPPRPILALTLLCLLLAGCQTSKQRVVIDYQTVAQQTIQDTERARRLNTESIDLIERGELDQAEQVLKEALIHDVMFGPAHNNLGRVYFGQKRYYFAAWEFKYAAKLMPNQPEPRNNLGLVFEAVGKFDQAVAEYDLALAIEPDNTHVIGNLARTHARWGNDKPRLRELLTELVLKDTRRDWQEWARHRLMSMGGPSPETPTEATPQASQDELPVQRPPAEQPFE
jgi:Flp pilus assembly protein TadD